MDCNRESCIVETAYGAVKGECGDGVRVWRGVPYAAPPVAGLRFKKPQPPERWDGVRDALAFGPMGPQKRTFKGRAAVSEFSEDCLTLNIWSPLADGVKRPVFFYIHGGSFSEGAGSDKEYEGTNLARDGDIIVITVNYRLGAFGFMNFSFLDDTLIPNSGVWDVIAALKWVNENIGAFGGDAGNLTVCGQSAGAVIACTLSMIGESKRLLNRIIMMSGIPTMLHSERQSKSIARMFLEYIGLQDAKALLAAPAQDIAFMQKGFTQYCGLGAATFGPCQDGKLLTQYPVPAAREGKMRGIPMLIGTTRDEMSIVLFKSLSRLLDLHDVRKMGVKSENDEARARISNAYQKFGRRAPAVMMSDLIFHMPSVWFTEIQSKIGDTWMYRFDYETFGMRISGLRAFHSSDVPFLFGNFRAGLSRYMLALSPVKTGIRKMHHEFRGDILTFVKTGELPWDKCDGEDTPAKCYAKRSFVEQIVAPELKRVYDGSEYKRKSFEGESVTE